METEVWQTTRLGRNHHDAVGHAAGRSGSERHLAGLRGKCMVRHWRSEEHALRAHQKTEQGRRQTSRVRLSVEAHQGVGTAVFAGATGRSTLAPANLALWKVDKEVDGVVLPSVVDF